MAVDPIGTARLCSEALGKEVTPRDIYGYLLHGMDCEGWNRFNTEEVAAILQIILKESSTDASTTQAAQWRARSA